MSAPVTSEMVINMVEVNYSKLGCRLYKKHMSVLGLDEAETILAL